MGPDDIEGLFIGTVQPERFANQTHVAPLVAELLGIEVSLGLTSHNSSRKLSQTKSARARKFHRRYTSMTAVESRMERPA